MENVQMAYLADEVVLKAKKVKQSMTKSHVTLTYDKESDLAVLKLIDPKMWVIKCLKPLKFRLYPILKSTIVIKENVFYVFYNETACIASFNGKTVRFNSFKINPDALMALTKS